MRFASTGLRFTLLSSLSACATIISGTSQRLTVNSMPEGAECRVSQDGMPVGEVNTPGSVQVQKSSGSVEVSCTKPGYQVAQNMQSAGVNGWVFGNIVFGGIIGVVVDLATGAAYDYGPNMMLSLQGQIGAAPNVAGLPYGYPAQSSAPPNVTASPYGYPGQFTGQPNVAALPYGYPGQYQTSPVAKINGQGADALRFYAATGRPIPAEHGLILLPPATPSGDYTYIWPKSASD